MKDTMPIIANVSPVADLTISPFPVSEGDTVTIPLQLKGLKSIIGVVPTFGENIR